jgi:cytoskeletal protein CcmA (bactofilin family)
MAIFKKGPEEKDTRAAGRGAGGELSISIIGAGMHIVGDVVTDGTVRIFGRIHGTVRASESVLIGKEGEVLGDVHAQEAVVAGRVRGTVAAGGRMHLQATCDIEGEIHVHPHHLLLDEGANFNGQVRMVEEPSGARQGLLPPGSGAASSE